MIQSVGPEGDRILVDGERYLETRSSKSLRQSTGSTKQVDHRGSFRSLGLARLALTEPVAEPADIATIAGRPDAATILTVPRGSRAASSVGWVARIHQDCLQLLWSGRRRQAGSSTDPGGALGRRACRPETQCGNE
jgi:hypothetical protein